MTLCNCVQGNHLVSSVFVVYLKKMKFLSQGKNIDGVGEKY